MLVSDSAAPVAHRAAAARRGVCVALEGHWREALADGKRGWVFDGCLSRYPAPHACGPDELAYAARVFGAVGKGAPRKWRLADNAGAAEVYWTRVTFDDSGEHMKMAGQGATDNLTTEGMPLTFNEALLWWLHFQAA
jgi:hypothetical protein